MSWSKTHVLLLVELVRRRPSLYDRKNEFYHRKDMKYCTAKVAALILSRSRPRTTATDVLKKWEELHSKFALYYKRKLMKQKLPPRPYFYDEMIFLLPHIDPLLRSPLANINVNIEDLNNTTKELKKEVRLSKHDMEGTKETYLPMNISSILCNSNEPVDVDMDNPSITPKLVGHETSVPKGKKRQASDASPTRTIHLSSGFPLRSFLDENGRLLDKTKAHAPESEGSINTPDPLSSIDEQDEDVLYTKYIVCRLKKLDENKKLEFKVGIERLLNGFY